MSRKVWKVNEDSTAGIELQPRSITATVGTAGHPNGILVDESGVYIGGKISLMTSPEQIRVGGFWVQQNPFLAMLPSTIAFPVPQLIFNPPVAGMAGMVETLAWAMGYLL